MDSLTQIVLGAAVGEAVLGKKIGNRAMLWGAVAGTIPDLDVIVASVFMNDINGLAFHRAITHSIFFAIFFSIAISFYTHYIYKHNYHRNYGYKLISTILGVLFMTLVCGLIGLIANTFGGVMALSISMILAIPCFIYLSVRLYKNYLYEEQEAIDIGWFSWYKLFFWAIFTHPLLDCLTVYGTQLFAPFTNYRVGLNNISVADPLYTMPFLICVIGAGLLARRYHIESNNNITADFQLSKSAYRWRGIINRTGIIVSSMYILFTFYNKYRVDQIMQHTLAKMEIPHTRYMTSPTILNNILWSGTVDTEGVYYIGQYSLFDEVKEFKLTKIDKNHELLGDVEGDHVINTLSWFSNGYYNVIEREDGDLQVNDMRYGSFDANPKGEDDYIFKFVVRRDVAGDYQLLSDKGGPKRGSESDLFKQLWKRIQGE